MLPQDYARIRGWALARIGYSFDCMFIYTSCYSHQTITKEENAQYVLLHKSVEHKEYRGSASPEGVASSVGHDLTLSTDDSC